LRRVVTRNAADLRGELFRLEACDNGFDVGALERFALAEQIIVFDEQRDEIELEPPRGRSPDIARQRTPPRSVRFLFLLKSFCSRPNRLL
jgi:hypothetical protein